MMKTITLLILFPVFVYVFKPISETNNYGILNENVELAWKSPKKFITPESVLFDKEHNIIYVSNINGRPSVKDSNGFISKISLEGEIIKLKWIDGLDAPKGMGITNGNLYVTDIDQVVEIDIEESEILKKYPVEGAVFLNDIAANNTGQVYISDMKTSKIHLFENGEIVEFIGPDIISNPNGLYLFDEHLLASNKNSILKINISTKDTSTIFTNTGGIDGLVPGPGDSYLISDWSGSVHILSKGSDKLKIIYYPEKEINAADIDYIVAKNMLLIPTFSDNRVVAYTLNFE